MITKQDAEELAALLERAVLENDADMAEGIAADLYEGGTVPPWADYQNAARYYEKWKKASL